MTPTAFTQGRAQMTYAQAKMIVWNYETYDRATVRKAAVFILGSMHAKAEDIAQASSVI